MENREVALILRETAQLLEIDGAIIGRYRSYEKVADMLFSLPDRIEEIAKDAKKLRELPGIGENMAEHIQRNTPDRRLQALRQKLLKKYPATLLELLAAAIARPEESRVPMERISSVPPSPTSRSWLAKVSCATSPASAKRANRIF